MSVNGKWNNTKVMGVGGG